MDRDAYFKQALLGFLVGLLLPLAGYLIYYFMLFKVRMTLPDFVTFSLSSTYLPKILAVCLMFDIPVFMLMYHFKKDAFLKGMLSSLYIYAAIIIGAKLLS